ncbi:MAG: tetratricopeptide repeat protein [Planctomycetota bacterium]
MAEEPKTAEAADEAKQSLLVRAREWATGSRLRTALVAGGLLGMATATVGVWIWVAALTVSEPPASIEIALEKLDEGDLEFATNYVRKMQQDNVILTRDYGGPLFVLGAVRAAEAEEQWAPERRRRDYLIASKYLQEARTLGVPVDREFQSLYLLGKSYIGSDQLAKGVEVLNEALSEDPAHATGIHALLGRAHYYADNPDYYEVALRHLEQVLADPEADPELAAEATLHRARVLSRLGRDAAAQQALTDPPAEADPAAVQLALGQVLVAAASRAGDLSSRDMLLAQATSALGKAQNLDKLSTEVSGSAQYLLGRIDQIRGQYAEALKRFVDIRKRFGASPSAVAASVAEGNLLLDDSQPEPALVALRRAASTVEDTAAYQSDLLSVNDLKKSLLAAQERYVDEEQFDAALSLIDALEFLLGPTRKRELQAETQQRWGDLLLEKASGNAWLPELQRQGRRRLREAGVTYEQLAEDRFATAKYPGDLWRAAESYYRGQSYTSAIRVLRDYIRNEPELYNAQALLRLGQSLLAMGEADEAVEAFEECIEFHPNDAAVYGARLAAAKAHRDRGKYDRAEKLLRENLVGGTLSPRSPEWRDSKFELGELLHEVGRHTEAIDHLEEAIYRYPGALRRRTASYLVAESYRQAAEEPKRRFEETKAVNEREKNERLYKELLGSALKHYDRVQREISRSNSADSTDDLMLRNCYMFKGSVLFDLERYREAVEEYSNVSALYQNEPFVLETLMQISFCWRRIGQPDKARGNVDQALLALERLPEDADFLVSTNRSRNQWLDLLNKIRVW